MISVAISSQDYLAALRLHRERLVKRQLLVLAALTFAGLLAIAIGFRFVGIVLIGAGVGGFIGEFVQSQFFLPRKVRRIYSQQASLKASHTYSWDEDSISISSETGYAKRPWSEYIKSLENDHLFLLYHSDIMFEMFPKSSFHSQEQLDGFRALASRVGT